MTLGGSINCRDCDDCAYQECLAMGVCLTVQAELMRVDPVDLIDAGPVWIGYDPGGPDHTVEQLAFWQRPFPKFPETLEEFQRLFLVTILKVDDQVIRSEEVRRE